MPVLTAWGNQIYWERQALAWTAGLKGKDTGRKGFAMGDSQQPTAGTYTIGYGARSMDAFIAALRAYGITLLVDVRSAPYSRYKPEFSKQALAEALGRHGIRYLFLGEALGGRPDDPGCYVDGRVDYQRVQARAFYQAGIARLRELGASGQTLAIMCSEGRPEQCHRSKLIGETLQGLGIAVWHIDEHDALITQEEAIVRLTGGQLSLFGDLALTSRQRYPVPDAQDDEEEEDG